MSDYEEVQRKRAIRELERQVRRLWRKGPDAPPNPCYKPSGIRERAVQFVARRGKAM